MNDKYGWNESGKKIRDAVPSEVTLTEDHRAILRASGHLIHANALVENQQEQIVRLTAEVSKLTDALEDIARQRPETYASDTANNALADLVSGRLGPSVTIENFTDPDTKEPLVRTSAEKEQGHD